MGQEVSAEDAAVDDDAVELALVVVAAALHENWLPGQCTVVADRVEFLECLADYYAVVVVVVVVVVAADARFVLDSGIKFHLHQTYD